MWDPQPIKVYDYKKSKKNFDPKVKFWYCENQKNRAQKPEMEGFKSIIPTQ